MKLVKLFGRNQEYVWLNIEKIESITYELRNYDILKEEKRYFTLIKMESSNTYIIDQPIGSVVNEILKQNSEPDI